MPRIRQAPILTAAGFFALFCLLFFDASVAPRPSSVQDAIDLKRFKAEEEERFRSELVDPDSAKFRKDEVSVLRVIPVVCGEVNFKNRGGGYRGFQRFLSGATIRLIEDDIGPADMDRLWHELCGAGP